MPGDNYSRVVSTAAAIAAAAALARKQTGATNNLVLPPEVLQLLAAMAEDLSSIAQAPSDIPPEMMTDIATIAQNLNTLVNTFTSGGAIKGYPANLPTIAINGVPILVANTPYQGPDMVVEDGFALVIKSHPDNAFGGRIFVAPSAAAVTNPNSRWALVQNEPVAYYVQNANNLWVSGDTPNDIVLFTVEKQQR